jgi:hypothetical protein
MYPVKAQLGSGGLYARNAGDVYECERCRRRMTRHRHFSPLDVLDDLEAVRFRE